MGVFIWGSSISLFSWSHWCAGWMRWVFPQFIWLVIHKISTRGCCSWVSKEPKKCKLILKKIHVWPPSGVCEVRAGHSEYSKSSGHKLSKIQTLIIFISWDIWQLSLSTKIHKTHKIDAALSNGWNCSLGWIFFFPSGQRVSCLAPVVPLQHSDNKTKP